ncbi:MAG TPA: hypothetical protein VFF68_12185 [Anaerolineaceae bacterium]|nr:hypothetical protein [Anaerolineaceae bacterium]
MVPRFSLQNVLDIRHNQVEAVEIELSNLLARQLELESRLTSLQGVKARLLEALAAAMTGEIDLHAIHLQQNDLNLIAGYIETTEGELREMVWRVNEKRQELVQAKQSEEMLQVLKRKRNEQYNAEQAQIESRALDDLYIARGFKQRR